GGSSVGRRNSPQAWNAITSSRGRPRPRKRAFSSASTGSFANKRASGPCPIGAGVIRRRLSVLGAQLIECALHFMFLVMPLLLSDFFFMTLDVVSNTFER